MQPATPQFRIVTIYRGAPIELHLTAGAARAMIDELNAGIAQLQVIHGDPRVQVQTSALLTRDGSGRS